MFFNINNGRASLARGLSNIYNSNENFQYLKTGIVVSIDDDYAMGRIKVRINGSTASGGDKDILDKDLPYAFPMLPKHINVLPKKGELVWIFVFDKNNQHADRMYIGPIISQSPKLDFDDGNFGATSGFNYGTINPLISVDTIPNLKGVFPDKKDISIQGRYNTDITQKRNEIIIRAGKFEIIEKTNKNPYPFKFNSKTQGFIQIKNDFKINVSKDTKMFGTVTNIVSNKINLITHSGGTPRFNVTNQDNLIDDIELNKILEEAHQLPFGDVLVKFLRLMSDALLSHVHNGNGNPATDLITSGNKQAVGIFKNNSEDLINSMLSENIRIN